jgi:hypothetical protein
MNFAVIGNEIQHKIQSCLPVGRAQTVNALAQGLGHSNHVIFWQWSDSCAAGQAGLSTHAGPPLPGAISEMPEPTP